MTGSLIGSLPGRPIETREGRSCHRGHPPLSHAPSVENSLNPAPPHSKEMTPLASLCDTSLSTIHRAGMAELADAADSKSAEATPRGGSTPPPGTNKTKSLDRNWPLKSERPIFVGGCFDGCWFLTFQNMAVLSHSRAIRRRE